MIFFSFQWQKESLCPRTVKNAIPTQCAIQPHMRKYNFTASNFIKKLNTIYQQTAKSTSYTKNSICYFSTEITTKQAQNLANFSPFCHTMTLIKCAQSVLLKKRWLRFTLMEVKYTLYVWTNIRTKNYILPCTCWSPIKKNTFI